MAFAAQDDADASMFLPKNDPHGFSEQYGNIDKLRWHIRRMRVSGERGGRGKVKSGRRRSKRRSCGLP